MRNHTTVPIELFKNLFRKSIKNDIIGTSANCPKSSIIILRFAIEQVKKNSYSIINNGNPKRK